MLVEGTTSFSVVLVEILTMVEENYTALTTAFMQDGKMKVIQIFI